MKQTLILAASLLGITLFVGVSQASEEATACTIKDVVLVCASSTRDRAEIMDAMADPRSLQNITKAKEENLLFPRARDRETFRKSLERNRAAALRHGRRLARQHRRGRLSVEEYQEVRSKLEAGLVLYRAGLDLYRQQVWFSKRPSRFADPSED